jgi:peptidoglycan hydrolase CwlO-like protein
MSKGYESLKGVVQRSLRLSKANPSIMARVERSTAATFNDEIAELEKIVVDSVGRLKAAVQEGEAVVAEESRHAGQIIESLRGDIALLEAKLKETEETIRQKESASQSMEKSLSAKIASLEGQLRETEKTVGEKTLTLNALEQSLTTKIHDLQSQLRKNQELLSGRDRQIGDLKSQLQTLTLGIKGMSSFFRQAEALAAVESQEIVVPGEPATSEDKKRASSPSTAAATPSNGNDAAREAVPRDFFGRMTDELSEVLGPMAVVIVNDHVTSLGETMEKFPKARLTELLDNISQEISDGDLKISFRKRLTEHW